MMSVWAFLGYFVIPFNSHNTSRHKSTNPAGKQETTPATNRQATEYRLLDLDNIHQYLLLDDTTELSPTDHILILTPLMDAARYLDNYFQKLGQIDYPAELISLGFLVSTTTEDCSKDPTLLSLQKHITTLRSQPDRRYRRITVLHQKSESSNFTHDQRHGYELQPARRKILARCRNTLLASALIDESWVLWLDGDVVDYPPDLLLKLIKYDKDIIAPNCFRFESSWFKTKNVPYDRNNWIETKESLANQRVLEKEEILFEGYEKEHPTYRLSMADLARNVRGLIEIDGVGGTFTLVKAAVHRAGINFPPLPVDHEIETEGMAKWAKREGFGVFVRSTTTTTTVSVVTSTTAAAAPPPSAPLSAVAARRQQLQELANKPPIPGTEEHLEVDNVDVDGDEKASLDSNESGDSDSDEASDQSEGEDNSVKLDAKEATVVPQNERRDRKLFLDPQSVSSFKPTRYNVVYVSNPGSPSMVLIGMRRGETLVFQGCADVIPLLGHATTLGYIMSGTAEKKRTGSKKNVRSGPKDLDLSSISIFPIISPRTHALAVIESIGLAGSQRNMLVPQGTTLTSPELKAQLETLTSQLASEDFDTVLAIRSASESGIFGIEKVVPLFKGILSIKQNARIRGNEDEEKLARIRFETSLPGFHPILEPTDSIAALRIPNTWQDAMQALIDSTVDENSQRVKKPPVSVVCGGKKMGKSTFSRLILNRMLNRYRKVAFIECDIGQSEFTPVGMVALHVIETPALGAPFTHPRQPYRAFFVGNSTPRDDPDYYMACLKELVKTYYGEVSHTRLWDESDDYHSDDDEDDHIPLIINTQGWIKGMGYDLLIQLLDYTAPSHIFGFHSPSNGDSNLPQSFFSTIRDQALTAGREQPTFLYVAAVVLGDDSNLSPFTKYHPADHRALALLSYFYLNQGTGLGGDTENGNRLSWDFTQALVVRRPWCWDWTNAKGVWVLFDQVPPSQILYTLNASLVALTGDKESPHDDDDGERKTSRPQLSAAVDGTTAGQIVPLNYFPLGQYPPPPPEHTTCHGLAIIRSIQPSTRTLHILTPLAPSKLKKCNGIVKGAIHMPIHASLDHNEDNSAVRGVAGVPWKDVPYLNYEAPSGTYSNNPSQPPSPSSQSPRLGYAPPVKIIGSDAKVTRKNLGRKRLQQ
ncbi:Polynucleotide 5'-hydroxyl-kinase grc3 [Linnemannia schmuckeri]|uniref:Polynucleotide 5'-hydroxyl-kinase GRC3 n=1 Tax=Linnemannia schmuckeri TaxID=64567 RepID=A0A9P5RTY2_9FUNG|nr:Polynucleotide 5'-hydroxyl-kinase grc3 [Linnemannia schmuckeri]